VLWRVVQDHVNPGLLFVGAETGVFFTVDGGQQWTKLKGGTPTIAFRDLVIQTRENDLVGATFGRSFYVLDDYSPLRNVSSEMLKNDKVLFPVRRAHWYVQRRPLSCDRTGCGDSQGHNYYVAPNPEFGANFTYYLPEAIQSGRDARRKAEEAAIASNADVSFPDWDQIGEEEREGAPAIVMTVSDLAGNIIRHIEGPVEAGFHRVSWNLRYPPIDPWTPAADISEYSNPTGVLVAPGTYSVAMYQRVNGELTALNQQQRFEVVSIREPTLPGASQEQRIAFSRQVDEMQRAVEGTLRALDEVIGQLGAIQETLRSSTADMSLYSRTNALQQNIMLVQDRLRGNETRNRFSDPGPMPVRARLQYAAYDPNGNAYGPTQTQRDALTIAQDIYAEVGTELQQLVDVEYRDLKVALEAANVPWTPGRGVLQPN
jgi:hypothetical protein